MPMKDAAAPARNSSIELLRMIAMLMITASHFATHGGFSFDAATITIPQLWWSFLELGGTLGVDIFVLISGYFLVSSEGIRLRRILRFWGPMFFYSAGIYLLFAAAGLCDWEPMSFLSALCPITSGTWWFASTYFVLYLLHPFLNRLIRSLDQKTHRALVLLLMILWSVLPSFTASMYQSNHLLWFIALYCTAGYIRRYGLNPKFSIRHYVVFSLVFSLLRYFSCVVLLIIGTRFPFAVGHSLFFYGQQSVLTLLSAVSLFMVFEKWNLGQIRLINTLASAAFGVYLIHEHNLIRPYLWHVIFQNARYQDSVLMIPYSILAIVLVYCVCTMLDLLRQKTVDRPYMTLVNRYSERIALFFSALLARVTSFIFG